MYSRCGIACAGSEAHARIGTSSHCNVAVRECDRILSPPPEDSPTPPPQSVFLDCGHATNDLRQDCRKAADVNTVVVGVGEDTEMDETTAEKLRSNKANDKAATVPKWLKAKAHEVPKQIIDLSLIHI